MPSSFIYYIAVFSGAILVALFLKGLMPAKRLSAAGRLKQELVQTKPLFYDINTRIIMPAVIFLHDSFTPKIYKEVEIVISKIRINVLKIERLLLRLTHYIRGKREVKKNGNNHPYWARLAESGPAGLKNGGSNGEISKPAEEAKAGQSDGDKILRI